MSVRLAGGRERPCHPTRVDLAEAQRQAPAVREPLGRRGSQAGRGRQLHGQARVERPQGESPGAVGLPGPCVDRPAEVGPVRAAAVRQRRRRPLGVRGDLELPGDAAVVVGERPERSDRFAWSHGLLGLRDTDHGEGRRGQEQRECTRKRSGAQAESPQRRETHGFGRPPWPEVRSGFGGAPASAWASRPPATAER